MRRDFLRLLPLVAVLAALLGAFGVVAPNFLTSENFLDLLQQISVNAIISFGITLTILVGGIDLSVGAVLALVGTVAVDILADLDPGMPGWLRLALAAGGGVGVAAAFGAANGVLAAKTAMPPFIITLGTMLIARGAAYGYNQARPIPVPKRDALFLAIGSERILGVPLPVLLMLAAFLAAAVLLHRTRFGQHLYAIGGNREAARYAGIRLARTEIAVYVLCSVLTGVAGLIHASQLYSAEPASGEGFELNAIAATVVGGTSFTGGVGTLYGTLLGAILMGLLDKGLNMANVHFSLQYVVKGAVILGAVYADVRRK